MRKTAFAAALAVVMVLPGVAMAGGHGVGHASKLHLSGVKLQFHFGHGHHRFFGPPKHKFHGKFRRPHFRGHTRFIVPHHPRRHHGFFGRPHHRPKHLHRGFVGPKVWHFKRRGHGHFKHRAFKHRAFKHRGFKDRRHGHFKQRHRRHWRR